MAPNTASAWALATVTDRELLDAFLEHSPDCIYFKDIGSRFLRISRTQGNRFGLSDPSEAVNKTDFDFFGVEHAQQALADEQEIVRTGQPLVCKEEKETWPDGHETWVSTTKAPLRNKQLDIIGTMGISRDITARYLAEVKLNKFKVQHEDLVVPRTSELERKAMELDC